MIVLRLQLDFLRKLAAGSGSACGDARQSCSYCDSAAGGMVEGAQPNVCAQLQVHGGGSGL